MKAINWAGAGASLLDPVSAHLITPRYEDGCCVPVARVQQRPEWNADRLLSTDRSGSADCRRHGAILAFIRGEAARSAA